MRRHLLRILSNKAGFINTMYKYRLYRYDYTVYNAIISLIYLYLKIMVYYPPPNFQKNIIERLGFVKM